MIRSIAKWLLVSVAWLIIAGVFIATAVGIGLTMVHFFGANPFVEFLFKLVFLGMCVLTYFGAFKAYDVIERGR